MLFNRFWQSAHFQNTQRNLAWLYIFLVFMSVFGILLIFEMHRGMWPSYTFFCFHECFWYLAHFGNTQRHAARLYIFSFSQAFFCICWFQIVFGILPIFKTHRGMRSGHIFSRSHGRLKKVIKVNFRSVIQLKYKKTNQEKVFLSSN